MGSVREPRGDDAAAGAALPFELPRLVHGLPPPPPRSLDPLLDAAAGCVSRYGVRRTSVQDVAAALGVNRTTVYRQAGNVESILRLLAARELHRVLTDLPARLAPHEGPEALVALVVAVVEHARRHPVVAKVLADELDVVGALLEELPELLGRTAAAITPLLSAAMDAGQLARRDPVVVAEWLVRLTVTAVIAPPPGDLGAFVAELLVPALDPGPAPSIRRTR